MKLVKRVLVVSYGGAHVAAALPLHAALHDAGIEPVMLGLTTAADVLRRHSIAGTRFLDHVDITDPHVRRWGDYLCQFHHRDGIGITREESVAYLGASLAELVGEVGEEEALRRYAGQGLNALLPVKTLQRIIKAERIDGVIATDSPRAERAALNAAALLGLPSVCLLTSFPHIGLHYLQRSDNGAVMCVLNERIKAQLVAAGRAADSVRVTGNPAFDALVTPDADTRRASLRSEARLAPGDWAVLWAEQPEPDNPGLPVEMRERLADICARRGWKLIVRLHPSSQAATQAVLAEGVLLSPRTESVRDALLKCDAVVTFTSTIGFEALVFDKPVVVATVSQYSHYVDYREDDGVALAASLDGVEPALASFHDNDAHAQQLTRARRAMPRGGHAARAVVDALASQSATPASRTINAS
ncbi:CDP-glycerol glycerophosphotransferase family protein [Caenimonas koreensis]|uniref:CDP-glycerol glycerophosphotransferase family protein n=1 Tax=Caenimonas koreensis TaxID=367474 RepID=UPI003784300D